MWLTATFAETRIERRVIWHCRTYFCLFSLAWIFPFIPVVTAFVSKHMGFEKRFRNVIKSSSHNYSVKQIPVKCHKVSPIMLTHNCGVRSQWLISSLNSRNIVMCTRFPTYAQLVYIHTINSETRITYLSYLQLCKLASLVLKLIMIAESPLSVHNHSEQPSYIHILVFVRSH